MEPELQPLEVVKRGETSITISIARSAGGTTMSVKAHPEIEAFFRGLGGGEASDTKVSGPYWRPLGLDADKKTLRAYSLNEVLPPVVLDGGTVVAINRVGAPLIESVPNPNDGRNRQQVNLSFLRLVGISEDAGVSFAIRGVHTYDMLSKLREQIGEGYRQLYRAYMKPVRMDIVVSTQETFT